MIGVKEYVQGAVYGGQETPRTGARRALGGLGQRKGATGADPVDTRRADLGGGCCGAARDQRGDVLQSPPSGAAGLPGRPGTQAAGASAGTSDRGSAAAARTGDAGHGPAARVSGPVGASGTVASVATRGASGPVWKKNESAGPAETEAAPAPPTESEVVPELLPEASSEPAPPRASRVAEHLAAQTPQRERECQVRQQAVQFVHQRASSCRVGAQCLGMSPRTLAAWRKLGSRGELLPRWRGRPPREPSLQQQLEVRMLLDDEGPRLGLPALQECCPATPQSLLAYLQSQYRRQFQQDYRLVVEALHWHRAGTVWAIDHSEPPRLVDGCYQQILAIRDLASGMQLAWTGVPDATAAEAMPVLEMLVRQYGPPLVLKSDNGSAFISHAFREWLEGWQITPLFSPVRMPRYNGACEAGIGAAKRRTEYCAARHNRLGDWTSDDLYAGQ